MAPRTDSSASRFCGGTGAVARRDLGERLSHPASHAEPLVDCCPHDPQAVDGRVLVLDTTASKANICSDDIHSFPRREVANRTCPQERKPFPQLVSAAVDTARIRRKLRELARTARGSTKLPGVSALVVGRLGGSAAGAGSPALGAQRSGSVSAARVAGRSPPLGGLRLSSSSSSSSVAVCSARRGLGCGLLGRLGGLHRRELLLGRKLPALGHDERLHLDLDALEHGDRDRVAADALDRVVERDLAPVDADLARAPDLVGDVRGGDGAEERPGRPGLDLEA